MPEVMGQFAMAAQLQTADRRARYGKLARRDGLGETVEARLRTGWTPEQIAGRMRLENARPRVCQETIRRHLYSRDDSRDGIQPRRHARRVVVASAEASDEPPPATSSQAARVELRP